jgi:hypothetical protein
MSQITDTPRPHTPLQVPDRSTSLGAVTGYVAYNSGADPPSRTTKKKLKRSASTLNKYVDAERWWFANDELVRIDLDEAVQQYEESKLLYTQGKMTAEDWTPAKLNI